MRPAAGKESDVHRTVSKFSRESPHKRCSEGTTKAEVMDISTRRSVRLVMSSCRQELELRRSQEQVPVMSSRRRNPVDVDIDVRAAVSSRSASAKRVLESLTPSLVEANLGIFGSVTLTSVTCSQLSSGPRPGRQHSRYGFMSFESEARGSRRESTLPSASPTNQQERPTLKHVQCFLPQLTAEEGETTPSSHGELSFERRSTGIAHSKKGTKCTLQQNLEKKDTNRPAQTSKDLSHVPSSFILSPLPSLFFLHSPSTVREGIPCRDSRPLCRSNPTTRPRAFPATTSPGPRVQLKAFANSQSFKKREVMSPGPYNPMTCSASLHTLPCRSHVGLFGQFISRVSPRPGT